MDIYGFVLFIFLMVTDFSSALDHSLITVLDSPSVSAGLLFLTGPGGRYQFDFTEAMDACLFKNHSMASRDQVQQALDQGLETCRFGWVLEQVAVVPRLKSLSKCGSGKTGVVTWNAAPEQRFGAWCFSVSDSKEAEKTTNMVPSSTTTLHTQRTTTFSATTPTPTALPSTQINPSFNPTPPLTTRTVFIIPSWIQTSVRPKTSFTSASPQTHLFSTLTTKSLRDLIHSSSAAGSKSAADSSDLSEPVMTNSVSSGRPPTRQVIFTALIILCVILLILSAGGTIFYYRLSERSVWSHAPQKDEVETEMWKQTCSELELNCQEEKEEKEEEEEEAGRKYDSKAMLYVNPDARTD